MGRITALRKLRIGWRIIGYLGLGHVRWRTDRLTAERDLAQAYSLRGLVFGEKLGWTQTDSLTGDIDPYDEHAVHFGVFEGDRLLAYCRLIPGSQPFMLEREFKSIVGGLAIRKGAESAEISRMVVREELWRSVKGEIAQAFVYRAMYRWAVRNALRYWYVVVTPRYFAKLSGYFGFEQISNARCFDDGVTAVAGVLDLLRAETHLRRKNRPAFTWYTAFLGSNGATSNGRRTKSNDPMKDLFRGVRAEGRTSKHPVDASNE